MQVFLKYYHSETLLKILLGYDHAATVLQALVRGWGGRRRASKLRQERNRRAAVKLQAGMCMYNVHVVRMYMHVMRMGKGWVNLPI